ncbi:M48 family metallopeptidase [Sulfuricurvum sp.]|uniref:M48 family metallopeptidase n=1 Tax=Sulfuricurvum sp. TaxID=2025608 RepID=UPI002E35E819|nr:M48 family metallopeptidase [Sulfuricurvum sp.]HEX5329536.1 M48 family metallopeptidase [Sulfuricurvum sp.]
MIEFVGEYYDGKSSRAYPSIITVYETILTLKYSDVSFDIPLSTITIDPTVGSARSIIRLADDAEIHSSDRDAIRKLELQLNHSTPENLARHLENKLLYAASALILTIAIIASVLRWGLPALAQHAATVFPEGAEAKVASETLHTLDELYLDPSTLHPNRQKKLTEELKTLCSTQECPPYELLFRNSKTIGANAFALPGNQLVITDQLIDKSKNDEEIIAVLAHELGHIKHKHILRMMFQSIGSGVVLVMITGDISNYSDLAAGIPAILLQQGYSRDMEDEADSFALNALRKAHIPPHRFADILLRIDPESNSTSTTLFSSHPDSRERIKPFLKL